MTVPITNSGHNYNGLKGVGVLESDGSVYIADQTTVFKKGEALDSAVEVLAGQVNAYSITDGPLSTARFGGVGVSSICFIYLKRLL